MPMSVEQKIEPRPEQLKQVLAHIHGEWHLYGEVQQLRVHGKLALTRTNHL